MMHLCASLAILYMYNVMYVVNITAFHSEFAKTSTAMPHLLV
jgi:hypothetical protein